MFGLTTTARLDAALADSRKKGRALAEALADVEHWKNRALASEGEIKRRADQARANFAIGRTNRPKKTAA